MKKSTMIYLVFVGVFALASMIVGIVVIMAYRCPLQLKHHFTKKQEKLELAQFNSIEINGMYENTSSKYDYYVDDVMVISEAEPPLVESSDSITPQRELSKYSGWINITGDSTITSPYLLVPSDMLEFLNIDVEGEKLTIDFLFEADPKTSVAISTLHPLEVVVPRATLGSVSFKQNISPEVKISGLKDEAFDLASRQKVYIDDCEFGNLNMDAVAENRYTLITKFIASSADTLSIDGDVPGMKYVVDGVNATLGSCVVNNADNSDRYSRTTVEFRSITPAEVVSSNGEPVVVSVVSTNGLTAKGMKK